MLLARTGKNNQLCTLNYTLLSPVKILNKKVKLERSDGFMSVSGV